MDSEKGNRVFARGHNVPPPPLVFGAQKKPGLDRVKEVLREREEKKRKKRRKQIRW